MTYLMARASLSIGSVPPLHRGQFSTHIHDWMLFSVELLGEDCTQISLYGVGIHQEWLWEVWILEHCSIDEGHVEKARSASVVHWTLSDSPFLVKSERGEATEEKLGRFVSNFSLIASPS